MCRNGHRQLNLQQSYFRRHCIQYGPEELYNFSSDSGLGCSLPNKLLTDPGLAKQKIRCDEYTGNSA